MGEGHRASTAFQNGTFLVDLQVLERAASRRILFQIPVYLFLSAHTYSRCAYAVGLGPTPNMSPGWHLGYSAFGLFGLIVLDAFGTLFAICFLRASKRMYSLC